MRAGTWWRLATLMALVYGVQGAWYPLLAVHLEDLGLGGRARGLIFATLAMGATAAPLGVGRIADRRFAIERLLSVIYLAGSALLVVVASGRVTGAGPLFGLFLTYWLVAAPALGLSTTLCLRNLASPSEQFGGVRAMGTVGWMVAGWLTSLLMLAAGTTGRGQGADEAFWLAAGLSVVTAVFAATRLPHTPPLAVGGPARRGDSAAALRLLKRPAVLLYILIAFGVTLTVPYSYQVIPGDLAARGLPRHWIAPALTLGQIPEILGLFLLPGILARVGYVQTMTVGIVAWLLRFGVLVPDPPLWVAIGAIPLHGIGIACFSIAGQMYLDRQAPPDRRAETQGLNVVVTTGVASLLGNLLAGELASRFPPGQGTLFVPPSVVVLACLIAWAVLAPRWARLPSATVAPPLLSRRPDQARAFEDQ